MNWRKKKKGLRNRNLSYLNLIYFHKEGVVSVDAMPFFDGVMIIILGKKYYYFRIIPIKSPIFHVK